MNKNIYLGTPVGGGVVAHEYVHSVLAIKEHLTNLAWGFRYVTQPDGLVTRSRNAFASVVVRDDSVTHLLMVDADVVVSPTAVERLVQSGHDVVGACVPLRQVDWPKVRSFVDHVPSATAEEMQSMSHRFATAFEPAGGARIPTDGFLPARVIGSAVLLVSRDALVRLVAEGAVDRYETGAVASDGDPSGWTFFDPLVDAAGTYLSEDYAFCERWRGVGGEVWVDLESPTRHVGPVAIDGSIATTLRAATKATRAWRKPAVTNQRSDDQH